MRQTIQKQCRFRAWCAVFHFVDAIGPWRTLTIRSQTVNPASSAMCMKSQCGHFERWQFTMSVIFASNRPRGFRTRFAWVRNGG